MKYHRAEDILPERLVAELQEYIQGSYLYIPSPKGSRRSWGELSGCRKDLARRNDQIKQAFKQGQTLEELADRYYLSVSTIRKIVYSK